MVAIQGVRLDRGRGGGRVGITVHGVTRMVIIVEDEGDSGIY